MKRAKHFRFFRIIFRTFSRLKPLSQLQLPFNFVMYVITLVFSGYSIFEWISNGFTRVHAQTLISLWGMVIFSNLCSAYEETRPSKDENNKPEKKA